MVKKINIIVALIIVLGIVILGCFYLNKHNATKTVSKTSTPTVEQMIASDSLTMDSIWSVEVASLNPDSIECKYVHYETCIELESEIDTVDMPAVSRLVDVYQMVKSNRYDNSVTTDVYRVVNEADGSTFVDVASGAFWLEDNPMTDSDIKVTFAQAFEKLQQANCIKPHSRYVTLRNAIGPHPTNTQWIFGNEARGIVYVDAVTGYVSINNPVYCGGNE